MTDSVVLPSTGYVYIGPVGTAMPTLPIDDPTVPGVDWTSVGNTSLENGISRTVDGDDPSVLGSWQNPSLVTTRPTKTRSVTLNLQDFNTDTFKLYYGGGSVVDETGLAPYVEGTSTAKAFQIPDAPVPQEHALLIVAVDGGFQVVEWYPKASFLGSDDIQYDPTALTEMPVTATTLSNGGAYTGVISERTAFGA
jgi:hypothetical protein